MSRFSATDTPLGKCDRCQRIFRKDDLKPDSNYKKLLVCDTCWDELDPFVALRPYQKNLDRDLGVKDARPWVTVVSQGDNLQTQAGQPILTEDGEDIGL